MTIFLSRTPTAEIYLSGFASYYQMQDVRKRAQAKMISVGWYGEVSKVKEYMAARWVLNTQGGRYRDYHRPETYTGGFSKALDSFNTALEIIGKPNYILIWQK